MIKFEEHIEDGVKSFIVMEYVDGGSLQDIIDESLMTEELAKRHFKSLLLGLKYMHGLGVIHKDLKPLNLLITQKGLLKIADFSSSQ